LEYGSPRVQGYDEGANQRAREDSLVQLDEVPTCSEVLPGPKDMAPRLQRRRPSSKAAPRQSRPP
jgi:hypothetical protein